jgi:hypothetical protein
LNRRPPAPEAGALPGYATPRRQTLPPNAPGGTRIPNLLIRSQMLYPIELRARSKTTADNDRHSRPKTDTDYRPHPPDRQPVHLAFAAQIEMSPSRSGQSSPIDNPTARKSCCGTTLHPVVTSMATEPTAQAPPSDRPVRRAWERPNLTVLRKLSALTLQTDGGATVS